MKKKIHEISDEELLKSLEGEDLGTSLEYKYDNPVLSFVQAFKIEPGTVKVLDKLLYNLFKNWIRGLSFTQATFNYQLDNVIPFERNTSRKYYLVNKKAMELAKQAEQLKVKRSKPRHKSKVWITHFESFLSTTGLSPGDTYVESDILYYVYNRWCDENRRKSVLGRTSFTEMCHLHFECKHLDRNDINWFAVNNNIKALINKEEVKRWRQGRKRNAKENTNETPRKKYQSQVLYKETFKKKKE